MVELERPIKILQTLQDISIPVGDPSSLSVTFDSKQQLTVLWRHHDSEIVVSDRVKIHREDDKEGVVRSWVEIENVTAEDGGPWTCEAALINDSSSTVKTSSFISVQIPDKYRKPEFIRGLKGFLWDNGTLSLECEVLGSPTPSLRWYKDGKQLVPGGALNIKANSKEKRCFLGIFACEAENCMGSNAIFCKVYAIEFGKFIKMFKNKN